MLFGRSREIFRLSSAIVIIFLTLQSWDVTELRKLVCGLSFCIIACCMPTLGRNTEFAEYVHSPAQVCVWGLREWSLSPCFSCNHRELHFGCSVTTLGESWKLLMQMFGLWYFFQNFDRVWLSACAYHLTITRPGRQVWFVFGWFSFSSSWLLWHDGVNYQLLTYCKWLFHDVTSLHRKENTYLVVWLNVVR